MINGGDAYAFYYEFPSPYDAMINATDKLEFASNLIHRTSGAATCLLPASRLNNHANYWSVQPASYCRGSSDVNGGTVGLSRTDWSTTDWAHLPQASDFNIASNSAAKGSGVLLTGTMLDSSWDWLYGKMIWLPTCNTGGMPSQANWSKPLGVDYCQNVRSTN